MPELLERLAADVGGRYAIEGELGRGGMATVYLARDLRDERRVAIKVLDPDLAVAVGGERFRREIEIAQHLRHPNVLGVHESGEAAGSLYYVMPYVSGESLRARLDRERQLPLDEAIRLATEVALALDYAHKQGVVHRDIKPENILLQDGHAIVADFGIARAASAVDNRTLTKTGVAIGTPQYMSPEQILANKGDVDGRTDQYALACMLYEMLAGQPPFAGPNVQALMAAHVLDLPTLVTRYRQSTPPHVEDALITALAKEKIDRFPTLADFAAALENPTYTSMMRATYTRAVPTPGQGTPARAPAWKRVAPLAAGLLLAIGASAGAWQKWGRGGAHVTDRKVAAEMRHIAVLYLDATGAGGELPALADGLTEALIARLRQVQGLDVVSRNGVAPFRGRKVAADSVARVLGVGTLVTGKVREDGGELRVDVRLLNADGSEIDAISIAQPAGAVLALRDSLAEQVVMKLRPILGEALRMTEQRASTSNAQAWALLQRGEHARRDADSLAYAEQLDAAVARLGVADSLYRRAAALDPSWPTPLTARAAVAMRHAQLFGRNGPKAQPWLDSTEALAQAALALAADDAEAYALRGTARGDRVLLELVQGRDAAALYAAARADLDTATTIDPVNAAAWNAASRLAYAQKNVAEAKSLAVKAYEADAYLAETPNVVYRLFITSHDLNQYQDARRYCDQGFARFPAQPRFVECQLMLQMMEGGDARPAEIWRLVGELEQRAPLARREALGRQYRMFAAAALVRAGLPDSARRVMEHARPEPGADPTGELMGLEAFVRARLGEKEEAIGLLERYVSEHPEHIRGFKQADFWWWRPLKDDPRFKRILQLAR